ncbi:DNA polymerase processivity factor [Synechococcus phage ACG-2014e]|uniref:Sliding clamp n=1 Tax=Synechococcus phage ACG-2014e TaxID=1493510 RepID=A0A0E3I9J8_9CAUD|nr:DNA polymerase processivity factor [Synechococcus phage ACG-2014e]YP_010355744.1 DNA polymerase processivity factor [Synechococcus phage ACG-2014e]AIX20595.1 sliding clamp DNA polymerase [Synechococcus phage ACG-2014e]AIX29810.1 sliding clamp DNA polymerase [Synechococcus phage ACG-2014e]AIX45048.1 sliding clamp DNA polymerase [Synechococcus phage ACG-2014e]
MSKVILSRKTLDVLKNFSTINSSIVFRKGSTVRTISNAENILAKFTGEEVFPVDFAIYDLSQFLSGISLFSDPQLEFDNENFVSIRGGRQSARYFFSDPEITLKSAPEKNVNFPGSDLQFNLTGEDLIALQKASAVYSLPDLTFQSIEGHDEIKLILRDKENDTSNTYDITVAGSTTGTYTLDLKIENIRLLPGDYTVKVSQHLISEWTNVNTDLTYYIALEPA